MTGTVVRFMHHPTSQPCRAVQQFMLEANIPFEEEVVNLMDGDNESSEFKAKYNPTGQVPILVDGDVVVWESTAIASYLNEKYKAPAHWFGSTLQQRAAIQQCMGWHSQYLRRGAGAFFYTHFAECIWGPQDYSKEIEKGRAVLLESMQVLETYWLGNNKDELYLTGEEISFADLLAYHEFVSPQAGAIISDEEWSRFPKTKAWFDRITERPVSTKISEMINQVGQMRQKGVMIPMTRKTSLAKGSEIKPGVPEKLVVDKDEKEE